MLQIFTSSLRLLFILLSFFVRFPRTLPLPSLALVLCFYLTFCSLFFPVPLVPLPLSHLLPLLIPLFHTWHCSYVSHFGSCAHWMHLHGVEIICRGISFSFAFTFRAFAASCIFFLPFPSLKILDLFHLLLRLLNYSGFIHNLFICV